MWVAEDGVYVAVLDDSNSDWDGMGAGLLGVL